MIQQKTAKKKIGENYLHLHLLSLSDVNYIR